MIVATLYPAQGISEIVSLDRLGIRAALDNFMPSLEHVALLLGCNSLLVDVLATGNDYVSFSIFDYECDTVNLEAMVTLSQLTGCQFDMTDDDQVLRGPVLLVQRN